MQEASRQLLRSAQGLHTVRERVLVWKDGERLLGSDTLQDVCLAIHAPVPVVDGGGNRLLHISNLRRGPHNVARSG